MPKASAEEKKEALKTRKNRQRRRFFGIAGSVVLAALGLYAFSSYENFTQSVISEDCPSDSIFVDYYDDEEMIEGYLSLPFAVSKEGPAYQLSLSQLKDIFAWAVFLEKDEFKTAVDSPISPLEIGEKARQFTVFKQTDNELLLRQEDTGRMLLLRASKDGEVAKISIGWAIPSSSLSVKNRLVDLKLEPVVAKMALVRAATFVVKKVYHDVGIKVNN